MRWLTFSVICMSLLVMGCGEESRVGPAGVVIIPTGGEGNVRKVTIHDGAVAADVTVKMSINGIIKSPTIVDGQLYAIVMPSNSPFCEPGLYHFDLKTGDVHLLISFRVVDLSSEVVVGGGGGLWMICGGKLAMYQVDTGQLVIPELPGVRAENGLCWSGEGLLCVTTEGRLMQVQASGTEYGLARQMPPNLRLMASAGNMLAAIHLDTTRSVVILDINGRDDQIDKNAALFRLVDAKSLPPATLFTVGSALWGCWDDEIRHTATLQGVDPDWSVKLSGINSRGNVCGLAPAPP